ncbi:5-methyltetrahydropteroyltriglutamate--homocysteine methyltransferase, partial [Tanacetum coccineum]
MEEIHDRVNKMLAVLETNILWVNPDCGLKTRKYHEVKPALENMVTAAKKLRAALASANETSSMNLVCDSRITYGEWPSMMEDVTILLHIVKVLAILGIVLLPETTIATYGR